MQFKSFDFIGNFYDGYLYQTDDKMFYINRTKNYYIFQHAYLNTNDPCSYKFKCDQLGINGNFNLQKTPEFFNPLSVNSIYTYNYPDYRT